MFSASPAEREISLGPAAPPPAPATANKVTTTEAKGRREPVQRGVLSSLAFPCLTLCQVSVWSSKGFLYYQLYARVCVVLSIPQ